MSSRGATWTRLAVLCGVLAGVCLARPALATQHLVSPGQDWSRLSDRLKPGDEIILMPGRHRPANFANLHGTADKPITIRGFDAKNPGLIAAQDYGLLLQRPRHVILQDLVITGARHNGINIDDSDASRTIGEPWSAQVTLRRVSVLRTGPTGNTDGIKLSGLRGVRLDDCLVEGWGGSAVDMVGCHEVTIENCTFRGLKDFTQSNGVQIKGGSIRVWILASRFEDAGLRAINLGGSTDLRYFRPPVPEEAAAGSRYEAEEVIVEGCTIIASDCAIAFVNTREASVRRNTIINPRLWVFRLLQETTDPRFGPSRAGTIGSNIIVWEPGKLRELINIGPNTEPGGFRFEDNIWWSEDIRPERIDALPGERLLPQRIENPELDDQGKPTNPTVRGLGAGE